MEWEEVHKAAAKIDVRTKQAAYELSYVYLDGGPAFLDEEERRLREAVARLPDDVLPVELWRDLFAWGNATYIARRRAAGDLPAAWSSGDPVDL